MCHTDHSCVRSVYTHDHAASHNHHVVFAVCYFFWIITFKAPQTQCSRTMRRLPLWCQWLPHVLLSLQTLADSHTLQSILLSSSLYSLSCFSNSKIHISTIPTPSIHLLCLSYSLSHFPSSQPLLQRECRTGKDLWTVCTEVCREMSLGNRLMLHMTDPETPLISRTSRTTNILEIFSCRAQTLKASFHSC